MTTTQITTLGVGLPLYIARRSGRRGTRPGGVVGLDYGAARRYVLSRRTPAGGYCYYRTPEWGVEEPNAPDTLAAIESFQLLDTEPPDKKNTCEWLRALQDLDGGFPTLRIGWAALRALALLDAAPARSPLQWISTRRQAVVAANGGRNRRESLADALRVTQLLHLAGMAPLGTKRLRALIAESHTDDARHLSDLETLAIVVELVGRSDRSVARHAATTVRQCEDPVLGLRIRPDAGATSVGALRSGLWVARQLGIELRHPRAIAASLQLMQRADGGIGLRHRAISSLYATWQGLDADRLLDHYREEQS